MTTATTTYVDFDLPDDLPERGSKAVYRVVEAGAALPPARKQASITANGGKVQPEFHLDLVPLSFRYENTPGSQFEDDHEHIWAPMFDRNGELVGPDSKLGLLKAGFKKIGISVNNRAEAAALAGKVIVFENRRRTINFKKTNEQGEVVDDPKNFWDLIPVELGDDNYKHTGSVPVRQRGPRTAASMPNVAQQVTNSAEVLPALMRVLNGKSESEYLQAIMAANAEDAATIKTAQAVLVEAASNTGALTQRMTDAGMRLIDGKLTI